MERRPHFGGRLLSVQLTVRVRGPVFILCSFSHNEVYVKFLDMSDMTCGRYFGLITSRNDGRKPKSLSVNLDPLTRSIDHIFIHQQL